MTGTRSTRVVDAWDFSVHASLFPFRSRWCDVDGIPLHYIDEGQGPVLLLLHGNFMWSFAYRNVILALRDHYRCIAVDLAGMGKSGKPHRAMRNSFDYSLNSQSHLITGFINRMGLDGITFLAYDHGGAVGFGVMTARPERFARLCLCNSWAWSNHGELQTLLWSKLAPRAPWMLKRLLGRRERWLFEPPSELAKPGVWEASIAPYPDSVDLEPVVTLAAQLTGAKEYFRGISEKLDRLTHLQVAIFWASKKARIFPEFVEPDRFLHRWRMQFPDAPVTLMPRAPYYFLAKPPVELIEHLVDWSRANGSTLPP